MLKILPTMNTQTFQANTKETFASSSIEDKSKNRKGIVSALAGLAVLGAVAVSLKHTSKMSYEEALKKAGVQIKDNVVTLIETGEKFTGKIERFETRNRKETVEFVDGLMKERIYHNLFGKELDGYFYKNGILRYSVSCHGGNCDKLFGVSEYNNGRLCSRGEAKISKEESVFETARDYMKTLK